MLVLTRKQQEKIQIGDDIVITVLRTKGKTVRIGIEAPSTTPVLRGELAVRMREEGATESEATATPPTGSSQPRDLPTPGAATEWNSDRTDHPSTDEPQVLLDRVPRSRVASVLPTMLGVSRFDETSPGPLRAMLDRRATSAI